MDRRTRLTASAVGVVFAPAFGLSVLSYGQGYSLLTATIIGTATAAVGWWAIATEP